MSEEPDDEGQESSDSSASGSGGSADDERERTGSEGPGAHEDEPTDDDQPTDSEPAGTESTDAEANDDSANEEPDEAADDESGSPDFTDVQGLGPDNDAESSDDESDDEDGSDDEDDEGFMFEDYDPNEPPTAEEKRGEPPARAEPAEPNTVTQRDTTLEEDGGLLGAGPQEDEEMPLAAHIEEMMKRLSVVFIVGGVVALTLLGLGQLTDQVPTAVDLIDILWNNAIPGAPEIEGRRPRLYSPMELILTELKVTALAGLLVALPVFVYETYLFMRPGLYPKERRYYISAIPTSLILGTIGMAFSHFIIIPAIMRYFTLYTDENVATVAYGLSDTFSLILVLMGYMAIIFQIPLFIMLAIMMGLVTRRWLEDKRLLFWGGFLTLAFLVNPDPTGMTPFIIAATMIVLYEGTLALLRWTGN